jgi:hypothetical protein
MAHDEENCCKQTMEALKPKQSPNVTRHWLDRTHFVNLHYTKQDFTVSLIGWLGSSLLQVVLSLREKLPVSQSKFQSPVTCGVYSANYFCRFRQKNCQLWHYRLRTQFWFSHRLLQQKLNEKNKTIYKFFNDIYSYRVRYRHMLLPLLAGLSSCLTPCDLCVGTFDNQRTV